MVCHDYIILPPVLRYLMLCLTPCCLPLFLTCLPSCSISFLPDIQISAYVPPVLILRMDINSGNPREVLGTPHCRIFDTIIEDILNHRSDSTYDIVYIPYHETKYIYRFTCPEFTSISKDQDYLRRCILQARFERRRPRDPSDPSANKFKEPQPFQLTALPRN